MSCYSIKTTPIKGKYQETPFEAISDNNKDFVWDKIIDLFAQKGLPIKIIDRSSGLIISEPSKLTWTYEDNNGKPYEPNSYVVIQKVSYSNMKKGGLTAIVTGEWNIRIKAEAEKTRVNINLVNIKRELAGIQNSSIPLTVGKEAVSTGVFEKIIFDLIK